MTGKVRKRMWIIFFSLSLILLVCFLPELMGWEECGSLLSHPNTVRESNGTTGFKEAREDFQICRNEEPGIIVGIL